MDDARIIFLFEKLLEGRISASEEAELSNYLSDPDNEHRFKLLVGDAFSREKGGYRVPSAQRARILAFLDADTKSGRVRSFSRKLFYAAAACLAIFMLGYAVFWQQRFPGRGGSPIAPHATERGSSDFSEPFAVMWFGGEKINLDTLAIGKPFRKDGLEIVKTSADAIQYLSLSDNPSIQHRVIVPIGRRYDVMLQDSSTISLNACSVLTTYPVDNHRRRDVSLIGEAYFDIRKDRADSAVPGKGLPFTVRVKGQTVNVLGTKFNVSAYADELLVKTTLVEGRVQFNDIPLDPGQQLTFSAQGSAIDTVNAKRVIAWREGYFVFHNEDIQSVMRQISRWYRVEVSFEESLSTDTFGGVVAKSPNLQDVLDILTELGGMRFSTVVSESNRNERRIMVMP